MLNKPEKHSGVSFPMSGFVAALYRMGVQPFMIQVESCVLKFPTLLLLAR